MVIILYFPNIIAIRVYRQIGDVGMVLYLQKLKVCYHFESNLRFSKSHNVKGRISYVGISNVSNQNLG